PGRSTIGGGGALSRWTGSRSLDGERNASWSGPSASGLTGRFTSASTAASCSGAVRAAWAGGSSGGASAPAASVIRQPAVTRRQQAPSPKTTLRFMGSTPPRRGLEQSLALAGRGDTNRIYEPEVRRVQARFFSARRPATNSPALANP